MLNEDIQISELEVVTDDDPDYTAGDNVGGLLEFSGAVVQNGGTARLKSVLLLDREAAEADLSLVLFRENPSNSTFTDNGEQTIHDDDLEKIIGVVPIAAADYTSFASNSMAQVNPDLIIKLADNNNILYGCLIAGGAIALATVSAYLLKLALERLYP